MSTIHQREQMDFATPVQKSGYFIKKKTALIITALLGLILIGVILATYFGTRATFMSSSAPSTAEEAIVPVEPAQQIDYRLPSDIKPYLYELQIKPYIGPAEEYGPKAYTFEGIQTMHLKCLSPTDKIVFHEHNLNIIGSDVELFSQADNSKLSFDHSLVYDAQKMTVTVNMDQKCTVGNDLKLVVPYTGKINTEVLVGFYKSSYVENGTVYNIASTDFEPADSRRAFPSMDEPAMKARFQLTMIRHRNFTSTLFNANLLETKPHPTEADWIIDQFDKSEVMSTYLVAFVVSNFKSIEMDSPKYGVKIGVAGRANAIDGGEGDEALVEAAQIIDFYSDYFGVKYPMPKSIQVGIPDFNSGAMENWGLVFYRESGLFFNPKTDTIRNRQRVSEVICHELAHQWNGNLVTMAWWNDLWLNEGFASWIENIGKNYTHPEWRDLEYFFINSMQTVLIKDSLESSHPINTVVNNPSEIGGLFDKISYDKGASIIRMMNAFLSEQTFVKGVSNYLKKYQFANAVQDNLWEELTKAAHEDNTLDPAMSVKQVMDTWTLQKGYPLIQINKNGSDLTVTQNWFLLNPENKVQGTTEYSRYKWYVPVTVTNSQEKDFDFGKRPTWLMPTDKKLTIQLGDLNENDWIIGNIKHAGYYRVNYDQQNWKLLQDQLKADHLQIDATSRATLLDDAFNLGKSELLDQTVYLDMASYLTKEVDPLPFTSAIDGLEFIHNMLSSSGGDYRTFKAFSEFYSGLVRNAYDRLGWKLDLVDANDMNLQASILRVTCRAGYQPCINQAREYYMDWFTNGAAIPANFKGLVYATVIESGNENDWQALFDRAMKEQVAAEKLRILTALTKSKDTKILKFFLDQVDNEEVVKKQDHASMIIRIADNSYGRALAFDYMDKNWDSLLAKYGHVSFTLSNIVKYVTRKLNSEFDVMRLNRFLKNHPKLEIAKMAFTEALEEVGTNTRWMKKNLEPIRSWLKVV